MVSGEEHFGGVAPQTMAIQLSSGRKFSVTSLTPKLSITPSSPTNLTFGVWALSCAMGALRVPSDADGVIKGDLEAGGAPGTQRCEGVDMGVAICTNSKLPSDPLETRESLRPSRVGLASRGSVGDWWDMPIVGLWLRDAARL